MSYKDKSGLLQKAALWPCGLILCFCYITELSYCPATNSTQAAYRLQVDIRGGMILILHLMIIA